MDAGAAIVALRLPYEDLEVFSCLPFHVMVLTFSGAKISTAVSLMESPFIASVDFSRLAERTIYGPWIRTTRGLARYSKY